MTAPETLSAATAARRIGVDRATMTRWIKAGKVPAIKSPGGQWHVSAEWVECWCAERERIYKGGECATC